MLVSSQTHIHLRRCDRDGSVALAIGGGIFEAHSDTQNRNHKTTQNLCLYICVTFTVSHSGPMSNVVVNKVVLKRYRMCFMDQRLGGNQSSLNHYLLTTIDAAYLMLFHLLSLALSLSLSLALSHRLRKTLHSCLHSLSTRLPVWSYHQYYLELHFLSIAVLK